MAVTEMVASGECFVVDLMEEENLTIVGKFLRIKWKLHLE